jgi:hypothetical protein
MKADTFGFDRDATFFFQVHRVEDLRGHLALRQRAGSLEQAVGQRGLAVVDMGDDAEISYEEGIHELARACCALVRF